MATSLAQIPRTFLSLDHRDEFIRWLASIPAPYLSKKRVLVAWAQAVGHVLSSDDYTQISIPPIIEASNAES